MGIDTSPNELLRKLTSRTSLHIGRVPKPTLVEFKAWAFEEFEGDYGSALKWLWDYYTGYLAPKESQVTFMIEELSSRVAALETKEKPEKTEENAIILGDGKRIEKRRR